MPTHADLTELHNIIRAREAAIADSVLTALRASKAEHYRAADPIVLKERIDRLVAVFLESLQGDPMPFVNHIRQVARERISEGFILDEIQLVLSLLEQQSWTLVTEQVMTDSLACQRVVRQLSLVTTVIGAAKDHLARVYLEQLRNSEGTVEVLQKRLNELFKGTERTDWTEL